jgi:hypothetical protein
MIKIYTDSSFVKPQFRKIIFPLLFDLCYGDNKKLLQLYQIVNSIEEADILIVPIDIAYFFKNKKKQRLFDFIEKGNTANKPVWVYSAGDFGISLNANVSVFRLGGFGSKLSDNTFILPSFINNPLTYLEKDFISIPKKEMPSIGFVGHADGSLTKWCKEFLIYLRHNLKRMIKHSFDDYQSFYPSSSKRYQFLKTLQNHNQIETDFIFRKKYRAGGKTEEEITNTTLEFFENIYNNPYVFCLRGGGNFSVRLYETIAMGRIPVVIDTDFRLPLNTIIPWEKHCVIVSKSNLINELIGFHKNISKSDFEKMQMNNRDLWLNYLNRESYFSIVYIIFKEMKV